VLQHKIKTVTESMEMLKTRTAVENAFFEVWNDLRWYARRKGNMKAKVLLNALNIWVRLLTPFTPHICEEIWNKMEEKNFVSSAEWPKYDQSKVNPTAEESETLVKSLLDDTLSIIRATKLTPKKICYYTSAQWKWKAYQNALKTALEKERVTQSDLMKELMRDEEMKRRAKKTAKFAAQIVEEINRMGRERKEKLLFTGMLDDPKKRAQLAKPFRPAIYIE